MPQTFLALFGIMIASTLSLSEQRHHALTVSTVVGIESDVTSAGIGEDYLDGIGTLAYDEGTTAGSVLLTSDLTSLEPLPSSMAARFPNSGGSEESGDPDDNDDSDDDSDNNMGLSDADSIDDLHGNSVEVTRQSDQADRSFRIETVVGYVSEADGMTPSAIPTKVKLVSARITPLDVPGAEGIVLSRLYSCGGSCDW